MGGMTARSARARSYVSGSRVIVLSFDLYKPYEQIPEKEKVLFMLSDIRSVRGAPQMRICL